MKKQDIVYNRLEYMHREDKWIHKRGREEIKSLIRLHIENTFPDLDAIEKGKYRNAYEDLQLDSFRWEYVNRDGKISKRIRKHFKKTFDIKLPDNLISKIGQIAESHMSKPENIFFDITNCFNWNSGDFGDSGSCFWGENKKAKELMQDNNFTAVRFYHKPRNANYYHPEGYARCWIFNNLPFDGMIIFNAYGVPLVKIARVLSSWLNWDYRRISLYNNHSTTGLLYLNGDNRHDNGDELHWRGGKAYILGKTEDIENITKYDIEIDDSEYEQVSCYSCGHSISENDIYYSPCGDLYSENDIYYSPRGDLYCESCFNESFVICQDCGETSSNEDSYYTENGDNICNSCFQDYYSICDHCQEVYHNHDMTPTKNGVICEYCLEAHYKQCEACEEYTQDSITTEDNHILCNDCVEYCESCKLPFESLGNDRLCEDCQTNKDNQILPLFTRIVNHE